MKLIDKYFPSLSATQRAQLGQLLPLYTDWNAKINIISRQDIENLEERHILHSLAVAKFFQFKPGSKLLDLGTGGGFPGLPLAILFPETRFLLMDGTGKKIRVVQEVVDALGLKNVTALQARAEELKMNSQFDFVLSRGVATLEKLLQWSQRLLKKKHIHAYPNGIIALKGGDLREEIAALPGNATSYTEVFPIRDVFKAAFFDEKYVVYVQG